MKPDILPTYLNAWRLFITAHARIISAIDHDMAAADVIPLNWYDVLIELYEAPDRRLRMSDLAERVILTRSGLTRLVDRLEQNNYIIRETDPHDRRGFYAVLTDAGVTAMRAAWPVYAQGIRDLFAHYMDQDQAQMMADLFEKILHGLDD